MSGFCIAARVYKSSATGVLKCAMKQGLEILLPELATFTSSPLSFTLIAPVADSNDILKVG